MAVDKRKCIISGSLAFLLTFMQIYGWQASMKYGTSVHQSALAQKIGMLELWQCVLVGIVEWLIWSVGVYFIFSYCEKRSTLSCEEQDASIQKKKMPKYVWLILFCILYAIYVFYLIGCYPGFYNYDVGNQIPQVLYDEVQYNAHHPLLHTLIMGGIIKLGYHFYNVDLTFGVFLYCAFQMAVCAASFIYSLYFIYQRTQKKVFMTAAFLYYAISPTIIMFAMSTTKDVLCYAVLFVAVLKLYNLYRQNLEGEKSKAADWIWTAALLVLSCLLRNNIIYGVIVFAIWSVIFIKVNRKEQIICYVAVVAAYFLISKSLLYGLDAVPGSIAEALSVPFQQMARLYNEKGDDAFEEEELDLLFRCIDREMIGLYDPVMADNIKTSFWYHLDTIMENKKDCIALWARKGLQYPGVYIASFLDNTYQAWYPGTLVIERKKYRYFYVTDWQDEYGRPKIQALYDFYAGFNFENGYQNYPVLRLFFSTGVMFWVSLATLFYGIWRKDKVVIAAFLLVLLVCLTSMCGPVSDVRYYLVLFYLLPVCIAFFAEKKNVECLYEDYHAASKK